MGRACSAHGEDEKCVQNSGLKVSRNLEHLGTDGMNIKTNITETGLENVELIHLAPDRDGGQALMNTATVRLSRRTLIPEVTYVMSAFNIGPLRVWYLFPVTV
jgi:hypothetical protein